VTASGAMGAGDLLKRAEDVLGRARVPEAAASAEFLLADVLGCGRAEVRGVFERPVSEKLCQRFMHLVGQRARRLPLAYVLGNQPFLGLKMKVTPAVLVPRPETEQLVEGVLELVKERYPGGAPLHILEIGTGTGCISIALAVKLPGAVLYATEISPPAMALAMENARNHHVDGRIRFIREDSFKPHSAAASPWADILVSNPPYIPTGDIRHLEPEVLQEPFLALDGGKDGLDAIRALVADAPRQLKPGGWLAMEFGEGQAAAIQTILSPYANLEIRRDIFGKERFVFAQCPLKAK
jgi:release factor glutamine methyltransferase